MVVFGIDHVSRQFHPTSVVMHPVDRSGLSGHHQPAGAKPTQLSNCIQPSHFLEHRRLPGVGRGDGGMLQQLQVEGLGPGVQQPGPGGRHHHRIDHQVGQPSRRGIVAHHGDDVEIGQHAGFDRGHRQVIQH